MFRYIVRRFLWAIVLFVAVTIVTYIIFFIIPADPAVLAAERRLLRRDQSADRRHVRRGRRLVQAHDPALVHVRDPERGDLRADGSRERDGHARRGLRPDGSREGRAGV